MTRYGSYLARNAHSSTCFITIHVYITLQFSAHIVAILDTELTLFVMHTLVLVLIRVLIRIIL
ncbi:hypothetical protein PAEAM_38710 [Paenibacillus sp. GM1FR]|nr:hypothetical protein PAEAM_38710 [Paenibacillus sp. GM1FR]